MNIIIPFVLVTNHDNGEKPKKPKKYNKKENINKVEFIAIFLLILYKTLCLSNYSTSFSLHKSLGIF